MYCSSHTVGFNRLPCQQGPAPAARRDRRRCHGPALAALAQTVQCCFSVAPRAPLSLKERVEPAGSILLPFQPALFRRLCSVRCGHSNAENAERNPRPTELQVRGRDTRPYVPCPLHGGSTSCSGQARVCRIRRGSLFQDAPRGAQATRQRGYSPPVAARGCQSWSSLRVTAPAPCAAESSHDDGPFARSILSSGRRDSQA